MKYLLQDGLVGNEKDVFLIKSFCIDNFNLLNAKLSDEYYYNSLVFCIIDAIFSIGVKYASTRKTVERYCGYFELQRIRVTKEFSPVNEQHKVSDLINNIDHLGVDYFSIRILSNRQRTSSKNGILKAEAVYLWAKILQQFRIETLQDFNRSVDDKIKKHLANVKGQRSGKSIAYLCMLCGDDNKTKPDRHILNFLSNVLNRTVNDFEAQTILESVTAALRNEFPNISIRLLDHTIWSYMSTRK